MQYTLGVTDSRSNFFPRLSSLLSVLILMMPAALSLHQSVAHAENDPEPQTETSACSSVSDTHHDDDQDVGCDDQDSDVDCDLCDLLHSAPSGLIEMPTAVISADTVTSSLVEFASEISVRGPPLGDKQSRAPPASA